MQAKNIIYRSVLIFLILLILFISYSVFKIFKHSRGRIPALSFGGQNLQVILADNYNWQQRDNRWQNEYLGEKEQAGTIGKYGCTVSAIANAISNLGLEITPKQLNQKLTQKKGFNQRGYLVWSALDAATDGKMQAKVFSSPSRADVDHCLNEGQYPIIKYLIGGSVQHWVTIVGKQNGQYLIRDPLIDKSEAVILSSRTPFILSLRCIGKK